MIIAIARISLNVLGTTIAGPAKNFHRILPRNYYPAKPFTNSTRLRSATPDGPFAIQGF